MNRKEILENLRTNPEVSVLVVGAGVNGIGTFRDLAHQGVDVLLIDKADFASGASAASSHMLHGGIRYLENGEFRLVREALTERNLMLRNAPHYAKPLPTTIPIFSTFTGLFNAPLKFLRLRDKPAERGALVIKLGLIMYDLFARAYKVMPNHQLLTRDAAMKRFPKLNPDARYVACYYDSFMPYPERICLELLEDGEAAHEQAHALNYVSLSGGTGDSVEIRDELTGETYTVKPRILINAAGPWIDFANDAIGKQSHYIGGTKGSHIIVDHPELFAALDNTEFFFENKDGRIVLILPYVDGRVMIGTTDIRIDNPDDAVCNETEIDYFLEMVDRVFPTIKLDRSHIVFSFSGVRPLVSSEAGFTGNVSRDHHIKIDEPTADIRFPILSLIGGKWTSYRAFAEQTADVVLARLGRPRRCSTSGMRIGGGKDYPHDDATRAAWLVALEEKTGVDVERLNTLFERYGTRTAAMAEFMAQGDSDAPLASKPNYTRRELVYLVRTERAIHLDDVVLRRTLMAWLGGFTDAVLREVADIVAAELQWTPEQKAEEIARAAKILSERNHVKLAEPVV
jgi:glycerol-3-phosphate dehydrogenase